MLESDVEKMNFPLPKWQMGRICCINLGSLSLLLAKQYPYWLKYAGNDPGRMN